MRLTSFNRASLNRLKRFAQWDVDESGQAIPNGGYAAQETSGPTIDPQIENRLATLEQMVSQYGETFKEWVDYLSQYNEGLSNSFNELWTDVNTIGNTVNQLKQTQPAQPAQPKSRWPFGNKK